MRYIHNITGHETFIASGVYTFYAGQDDVRIIEEWSLHQQPDGSQMIRADHDARLADGSSLLIEVYRHPEGMLERLDFHQLKQPSSHIRDIMATYTFMGNYVHIGRTINHGERLYSEMAIPKDILIFPLAQFFIGEIVVQLSTQPTDTAAVFIPVLEQAEDEKVLTGHVEHWQAHSHQSEQLEIAGKTLNTRCYQLSKALDDAGTHIWLDADNLLRQVVYTNEGITCQVVLTQYAHRPQR